MRRTRARALLIGCGTYLARNIPNVPAVKQTVEDFSEALVNNCGFPRELISKLLHPSSPGEVGDATYDAAEKAEELFLLYYVGHGFVHTNGELYLATTTSDRTPGLMPFRSTRYATIRETVQSSPAPAKIVILDCCFSGEAVGGLSANETIDLAGIQGAYVITASSRDETASAPPGEDYTAFTGELIGLLNEGDETCGEELTLRSLYHSLRRRLSDRGLPLPRRRILDLIDEMPFARNNAYKGPLATASGTAGRTWGIDEESYELSELEITLSVVYLPESEKSNRVLGHCYRQPGEKVKIGDPLFLVDGEIVISSPVSGLLVKVYRRGSELLTGGERLALVSVDKAETTEPTGGAQIEDSSPRQVPELAAWSASTVFMPSVGTYAPDARITEWLKYVGDVVDIDEPLFIAENDIITIEVPSPISGVLVEILVRENETVDVGAPVALIQ